MGMIIMNPKEAAIYHNSCHAFTERPFFCMLVYSAMKLKATGKSNPTPTPIKKRHTTSQTRFGEKAAPMAETTKKIKSSINILRRPTLSV